MKRILSLLLTVLLALALAGCGNTEQGESSAPINTKTSISAEEANYWGHYPYLIEDNYFTQGNPETKPGVYRQTTVAVGSFEPNALGLYDMHGNVGEWV